MDGLTLDGKVYISSKKAAKITGYAKDYVGQLCREGRVQARLVGRNWYVLEDSIREHRFGVEEAPKLETIRERTSISSWETSSYAFEQPPTLPVFEKVEEVPVIIEEASTVTVEAPVDHSTVVKEMQTAWQDWFKNKNEQQTAEQILLESPEVLETTEETVQEAAEEDVEIVPIHRTYSRPEPAEPLRRAAENPVKPAVPAHYSTRRRETVRIYENHGSSLILKALFVAVTAIVIAITVVGSGYLDTYLNRDSLSYFPIQYLGGERLINKQ